MITETGKDPLTLYKRASHDPDDPEFWSWDQPCSRPGCENCLDPKCRCLVAPDWYQIEESIWFVDDQEERIRLMRAAGSWVRPLRGAQSLP